MELQEITQKVQELWFSYQFDKIYSFIQLPVAIFEVIALYKINQVLKIYIYKNQKYL